jgi:hypothetical protein
MKELNNFSVFLNEINNKLYNLWKDNNINQNEYVDNFKVWLNNKKVDINKYNIIEFKEEIDNKFKIMKKNLNDYLCNNPQV